MALVPLASVADLSARNIAVPLGIDIDAILDAASSAIREAAGSPISRTTSTVALSANREQWLPLPFSPIHEVTDVAIDGVDITDWRVRDGRLWRPSGWQNQPEPPEVTLTVDHGLDPVPADIVDLCCSLVAASIAATEEGYDPQRGLASFSIDDYREGYTKGEDEVVNPLDLPTRTREWLRQRFGRGAHVVGTY